MSNQTATISPIPLMPAPEDFTRRGLRAQLLLSVVQTTLNKMVREAAENSHEIEADELLASIDAHLSDVASDISGAMNKAAERIIEDRYDGCARGPMYRARP